MQMNQWSSQSEIPQHLPFRPTCPECGESLKRVRRSFGERMLSLIAPRFRYRCRSYVCRWEGSLPDRNR